MNCGKKVKCINTEDSGSSLILGKIYIVREEDKAHYYLEGSGDYGFFKYRFMLIKDYELW